MPIETEHRTYQTMKTAYQKIADVMDGEDRIKEQLDLYLPQLSGQTAPQYRAYIQRGSFFPAMSRTVTGLSGAMMRKAPQLEMPSRMESFLTDATNSGISLVEAIANTCDAVLTYGRRGILIDHDGTRPYFSFYSANSIVNWKPDRPTPQKPLEYVILKEYASIREDNDPFKCKVVPQIRALVLENGAVYADIYQKQDGDDEWRMVDRKAMTKSRKPLKEIPFVFIGSTDNLPIPNKPPLYGLVNLNLTHWRTDCDYRHGLHYCALPTVYAMGFDEDAIIHIGPGACIKNTDPDAQVGMLEFEGAGLGAVREALSDLKKEMAVMGARLLEEQKKAVETAEGQTIRQSGNAATLVTLASNIEKAFEKALRFAAQWEGIPDSEISCTMNRDFIDAKLTPEEIGALLEAYLGSTISLDTLLYNFKRGEILIENRTIKEEKDLIEAEASKDFSGKGDI